MKCNRVQLGDILGLDPKTVEARVKEGLPYLKRPGEGDSREWQFDTVEVIDWLTGRVDAGVKNDEAKDAKIRIAVADAGLKELELLEKQRLMINIEEIMPQYEESVSVMKSGFGALPGRLAQVLAVVDDPAEVSRLIKAEVDAVMDELNRRVITMFHPEEESPGDESED